MKQLLVPIDGSELSERAVPYAALLAKAQAASVKLVRVFDPPLWDAITYGGYADPEAYDQIVGTIRDAARTSLERTRGRFAAAGVGVDAELVEALSAGAALLDAEARPTPDLVVMATHGRQGLARFALGSVADRLVRDGSAPVLLIPAFGDREPRLARALVPLDGSPLAEQALFPLEELARKPLTDVVLLQVLEDEVHEEGRRAASSMEVAEGYLREIARRLSRLGLMAEVSIAKGEPSEAIRQAADSVDVVIMTTHGRGGFDRWRHGSVAERAARHLPVPRLLIRSLPAAAADLSRASATL